MSKQRVNKTRSNLQAAWDRLDSAYGDIENAIDMICSMSGVPSNLLDKIDRFDITMISSMMECIEEMMNDIDNK